MLAPAADDIEVFWGDLEGNPSLHVDHAKTAKLSHSNLLNKPKRQTIEAFGEKGGWKIGFSRGKRREATLS